MRMHRFRSIFAAVAAVAAGAAALLPSASAQDVLRPEAAYPYTVEAADGRLTVSFDVEDGYYLYRERFGFDTPTDGVGLGTAEYPAGEMHNDEFFGEQEIYRGQ